MRKLIATLSLVILPFEAIAQSEIVVDVNNSIEAPDGAVLRGLDRINGVYTDINLRPGDVFEYERLSIELIECRYPEGQTTTEAFANLRIRDLREDLATFSGWMFASSPALSALDHPRYDVWVLRCNT